jgi:hypothetical protein
MQVQTFCFKGYSDHFIVQSRWKKYLFIFDQFKNDK